MKEFKGIVTKSIACFLFFTLFCGVGYTLAITCIAQAAFPQKANGSIITVGDSQYSTLLGQAFAAENHLWGRMSSVDTESFTDENGKPLAYAWNANMSPANAEYATLVGKRLKTIQAAHPTRANQPVPVDLVTYSASGLDPQISLAAANYQVDRLVAHTDYRAEEIEAILAQCTSKRFLGLFGEPVVNVVKVNLLLDGILE